MKNPRKTNSILENIRFPRLSEDQCEKIHAASLEILEHTGVRLDLAEAVELLKKAGATVNENNMVKIPASLVEKALTSAPKEIILYDREGNPVMPVSGHRCFYGPGSDCLHIIDHRKGIRRQPTLEDVREGVTLCDALTDIDFVMSMLLPADVDTRIADRYQMEAMLSYTSKPIIFVAYEFDGCKDSVDMAEAIIGGADALVKKPLIACYINVVSGLWHNEESLQKLLFLTSKSLPVLYIPSSTAGVTSPVTPVGALAYDYAGVLAGLVLSQLNRAGCPIIIPGMPPGQLDMRTMVSTYCEPERSLAPALAHFYNLPMFSLGGASESKVVDQQAAAEAALSLVVESIAGGNIIHDLGYLESGLTFSFAQLLICEEIVSWIKAFGTQQEINRETLGLDVIAKVGPEGQYLDAKHTSDFYRDRWYPRLFERGTFETWQVRGEKDLAHRAADAVNRILDQHQPTLLPATETKALRQLVQRAETGLC